jgi:hypothetical protein
MAAHHEIIEAFQFQLHRRVEIHCYLTGSNAVTPMAYVRAIISISDGSHGQSSRYQQNIHTWRIKLFWHRLTAGHDGAGSAGVKLDMRRFFSAATPDCASTVFNINLMITW